MKRSIPAALALLLAPATLAAQMSTSAVAAAASITEQDIYQRIGVLAHDSMGGRDTPSPQLETTANYIAREFESFGLQPLGDDGGYLQRFPLEETRRDLDRSTITADGGLDLRLGDTFQILFQAGTPPETVTGPMLVVSGSASNPAEIAELNVGGSVAVVVAGTENGQFTTAFRQSLRPLLGQRPAAVIVVSDRSRELLAGMAARLERPSISTAWGESGPANGLAFLEVHDDDIRSFLASNGFDLAEARSNGNRPISATSLGVDATVSLSMASVTMTSAPNVVGLLVGSDPQLKDEYVVFSAHMDHVGIGASADGDSIFNGADDDASGTAAVIELAQAFAMMSPAPRRSMIFLTVSGEEKGLWGSDYFGGHSPVEIGQIVANLNIDMVGRNWPDTIVAIGREHSDLGETLNEVNEQHPELGMTAIDDLWPDERFFFRSDHYNFARRGVPILFFFNGTHEDYHQPSDELEKIDAEKESRIARLLFYLGLEVANATERPQWNPESYEQIVDIDESTQ